MPKPWARERTKRRKAEAVLRAEEEQSHPPLVSNPSPSPNYVVLALSVEKAWRHQFRGIRYPVHTGHHTYSSLPANSVQHGIVSNSYGNIHQQPLAAALPVDAAAQPLPRDFSALRSEFPHPWRTVRRRNHRLLPQRREQRSFPKSLPRRPVISAPRAAVLALHDSLPISVPTLPTPPLDAGRSIQPAQLLGLMPLHPDDPIHPDDVASIVMPAPSLCPCPADHSIGLPVPPLPVLPSAPAIPVRPPSAAICPPPLVPTPSLPVQTSYGLVRSSLALACATASKKNRFAAIIDIVSAVWGPTANKEKGFLAQLPGDQLVFLCTLADFVELEPVFAAFIHPAITGFVTGWVDHCRREDAGG
ncbi:hypothetical protein DFH06DRAFT_1199813 [Mycena polygramma]|nr:hypothetical protein DFH06DRAFT_1199813 [Mycena polygramma]